MRFTPTRIDGAWIVEREPHRDERGHFARTFCVREFSDHGLDPTVVQSSESFNRLRGTVRGMHWQAAPAEEAKLVRVVQGAIHDVIVELATGLTVATELSAANGRALYIPPGCAHGFQTLQDGTTVAYQMNEFFSPEHARGARWDDPAMDVHWPIAISAIAEKDLMWPAFERQAAADQAAAAAYQR
jgi:dTDP-4-dehydrorhamnose 3,5-epimerase